MVFNPPATLHARESWEFLYICLFIHAAKNRRIPASETRAPEAADGVMQTHHVLVGDQMPRGPSGLLDCSGSSLISPALKLEEISSYSM